MLRDRQAAEELAQDVFVRAYERLASFDVRQPMKPWLAKIAYRLAQERWSTSARERAREKVAATILAHARAEPRPPDSLELSEQSEMLWEAVHALPMAQRAAVILYYRDNLSVDDVATAMGVSTGTVKTHLFRARAQIQKNLRAKGFDEGGIP
jgi:RNA polymerase sigma-70 factor (ECF subfamily)